MLENLVNPTILWYNGHIENICLMPSNNLFGAENQQERLKVGWIVGFVDGEGCFSVSIIKNQTTALGWQIFPEFVVTQGEKSRDVLNYIQKYFGCGNVYINRRRDNHKENLCRYCVRSVKELNEIIIPFFQKNQLQTAKKHDFMIFSKIVGLVLKKEHLKMRGLIKIAKLIERMNRRVPARLFESSETKRQYPKKSGKI